MSKLRLNNAGECTIARLIETQNTCIANAISRMLNAFSELY